MKRKEGMSFSALGASSLLTAFGVLCLTVFALLSIATVRADQRLAESSLQAISAYYEADLQAEEIFARLRNGEEVTGVTRQDGVYAYTCPLGDSQYLAVEIENQNGIWQVLRWQAVALDRIQEEQTLNLWDGSQEGS